VYPSGYPKRDQWFTQELRTRGLEQQYASRFVGGWNTELAARAKKFHEESEQEAGSGAWASKAYIFYSVAKAPTMLSVHFECVAQTEFHSFVPLLDAEGFGVLHFADGDVIPPRREEEYKLSDGRTIPAPIAHQWTVQDGRFFRSIWRLHGVNEPYK